MRNSAGSVDFLPFFGAGADGKRSPIASGLGGIGAAFGKVASSGGSGGSVE